MRREGKTLWLSALLLLSSVAVPQTQQTNLSADQLRDLAERAKSNGDLQSEVNYICQAATLDGKKYGKRCEKDKQSLTKTLAQFQANLEVGRNEIQQKNYPGAIRDLSQITFGPNRIEAQEALQEALILGNRIPPNQMGPIALQAARRAFSRGSFEEAETLLTRAQTPATVDTARQLLGAIHLYRDSMGQANSLAHSGDYRGAAKNYQTAISILANGPGQPQERLREVQRAIAATEKPAPPPVQAQQSAPETPAGPAPANAAKITELLAAAHRQELRKDLRGAKRSYEAVLQLEATQTEALAGKKRILAAWKNDPKMLEENLIEAISDFYASRFADAAEKLRAYLQGKGGKNAGAAHFYLASSLLAQAFLSPPKEITSRTELEHQAQQEFALARQLHYAPIIDSVSPKILAQWDQKSE